MSYTLTTWLTTSEDPTTYPLSTGATEATARRLAEAYQQDGYHVEIWTEQDGRPVLVDSLKPAKPC